MPTHPEAPAAECAPRVPVAASSERGSVSRSTSAHQELPEFASSPRLQSAAGHRPALRSGARASARFTARIPVASKTNSTVTNIRALKRRERRAPLTPEASNTNSRGCQPTVNRAIASRPRRGRTIPHATIGSTLSGSWKISGTCSVGLHPRLFTHVESLRDSFWTAPAERSGGGAFARTIIARIGGSHCTHETRGRASLAPALQNTAGSRHDSPI
jgi:hypothetical protein